MSSNNASPLKVCYVVIHSSEWRCFFFIERDSYRKSNSFRTGVHTLHVHVRAEKCYFSVVVSVRLHSLEERLSIMKDGHAGF